MDNKIHPRSRTDPDPDPIAAAYAGSAGSALDIGDQPW